MGQLADWSKVEFSPGRFQALSDIKGIGSGTAQKIEDACMKFWASRPAAETVAPGSADASNPTETHPAKLDAAETQPEAFDATVDAMLEQAAQVEDTDQPNETPEPAANGKATKGRKKGAKP